MRACASGTNACRGAACGGADANAALCDAGVGAHASDLHSSSSNDARGFTHAAGRATHVRGATRHDVSIAPASWMRAAESTRSVQRERHVQRGYRGE